ncbi:hypothetical protein IFM89_030155, partial [Coptis chinensis]
MEVIHGGGLEEKEEQQEKTKQKIEKLQADMKNLFYLKEKKLVAIGCKNLEVDPKEHTTLVGKLFGGKHIPLQVFADEVHRNWQTKGQTSIEMVAKGMYKMVFENGDEYNYVRQNGPWLIQGFILSIKKGKYVDLLEDDWKFDKVDFWIHIYGLPRDRINEENINIIGMNLGKVKGVDTGVPSLKIQRAGCIGHDLYYCILREKLCVEMRSLGGSPRDIKNNFSFLQRANVFFNGLAASSPAIITISGTPKKPRSDQIPA